MKCKTCETPYEVISAAVTIAGCSCSEAPDGPVVSPEGQHYTYTTPLKKGYSLTDLRCAFIGSKYVRMEEDDMRGIDGSLLCRVTKRAPVRGEILLVCPKNYDPKHNTMSVGTFIPAAAELEFDRVKELQMDVTLLCSQEPSFKYKLEDVRDRAIQQGFLVSPIVEKKRAVGSRFLQFTANLSANPPRTVNDYIEEYGHSPTKKQLIDFLRAEAR